MFIQGGNDIMRGGGNMQMKTMQMKKKWLKKRKWAVRAVQAVAVTVTGRCWKVVELKKEAVKIRWIESNKSDTEHSA